MVRPEPAGAKFDRPVQPGGMASLFQLQLRDLPLDSNGMLQSAAASGTTGTGAPNWETTLGQITPDGTLSWRNIGVGRTWSDTGGDSTTTYAPNDQIIDANGNLQICSVGGNSGGVAPNWGTVPGDTTADGQVTWTAQVNPAWVGGVSVALGAWLIDSNGKTQRCTVPGISGATQPAWNSTVGESTQDSAATWTCVGKFTTGIGTLEVEFEGGGMYDLYIALLVASPFAAAAAAVGWIPFLGWLLALLLSLIAGAIAGIGYAIGHGDTADPNADDPTIGTIFPGQDVLIVMGAWMTILRIPAGMNCIRCCTARRSQRCRPPISRPATRGRTCRNSARLTSRRPLPRSAPPILAGAH